MCRDQAEHATHLISQEPHVVSETGQSSLPYLQGVTLTRPWPKTSLLAPYLQNNLVWAFFIPGSIPHTITQEASVGRWQ